MKVKMIGSLVVMAILLCTAGKLSATTLTQCPDLTTANGYPSCAYLITINPDGTTTVTNDSVLLTTIRDAPDNTFEDVLFGVQNNSGVTIGSLHVVGGLDDLGVPLEFFGFDGDFGLTNGPKTYEGPGVSFANITASNIGDVVFSGGLAPSASAYFGLEGSAQVDGRPIDITSVTAIPAPEPTSLALLLTGLGGLLARRGWSRS